MQYISRQGFPYSFDPDACETCEGKCCRGESGFIWVDSHELHAIALLLGMNDIDFMQKYIHRIGNRLSLNERTVGRQTVCVFFDMEERKCTIYSARPNQCRRFPFWEYYRERGEELMKECPGIRITGHDT